MAKYAVLKKERDEAVKRAVEAERLSRKEEVDRIQAELERTQMQLRVARQEARDEAVLSGRLGAILYNLFSMFADVSYGGSRTPAWRRSASTGQCLVQERQRRCATRTTTTRAR